MTKEELEKEVEEYLEDKHCKIFCIRDEIKECKVGIQIRCMSFNYKKKLIVNFAESREKRIAELEEKISILLSCKNCPENKGGLLCQKEYEDKCLAQKIQFIKELQEENAELKEENRVLTQNLEDTEILNKTLVNRNAELKELLKQWLQTSKASGCDNINIVTDTEQFISEVEK